MKIWKVRFNLSEAFQDHAKIQLIHANCMEDAMGWVVSHYGEVEFLSVVQQKLLEVANVGYQLTPR